MGGLHRQCHAYTERRECYHRRCAHAYENHLPEDRRDPEKLTRERRNENPVEQTEIELEIIFQSESGRCAFKSLRSRA
jgi:hypothetical protein